MSLLDFNPSFIVCTFFTGLAVLVGFGFGLRALVLATSNPEASSLKLIALNLLEPSLTILVLCAVSIIGDEMNANGTQTFIAAPMLAAIPCGAMLLAPVWTKTTHPIRGRLIVYGLLRWCNTIAFWIFGVLLFMKLSNIYLLPLTLVLMISGTLILCSSVVHLAVSLGKLSKLGKLKTTVVPNGS